MQHDGIAYEGELSEAEQRMGMLEEKKNSLQNNFESVKYFLIARDTHERTKLDGAEVGRDQTSVYKQVRGFIVTRTQTQRCIKGLLLLYRFF